MKGKLISEDVQRTFAVTLNTDDEALAASPLSPKSTGLSASQFDLNGPVLTSAEDGQFVGWLIFAQPGTRLREAPAHLPPT
jgi:hypothetical protein